MPTANIKPAARAALAGRYLQSVSAYCMLIAVYAAIVCCGDVIEAVLVSPLGADLASAVATVPVIIGVWLIAAPLMFGIRRFLVAAARGESDVGLVRIFDGFGTAWRKITALKARVWLRAFAAGAVQYVAGAVCAELMRGEYIELSSATETALGFLASALFAAGAIASVAVLFTYFLSDYLLIGSLDAAPIKSGRALKESRLMMKGRRLRLFELYLRFAGWLILCITGLAVPFVAPYLECAKAHFALGVISEGRQ